MKRENLSKHMHNKLSDLLVTTPSCSSLLSLWIRWRLSTEAICLASGANDMTHIFHRQKLNLILAVPNSLCSRRLKLKKCLTSQDYIYLMIPVLSQNSTFVMSYLSPISILLSFNSILFATFQTERAHTVIISSL